MKKKRLITKARKGKTLKQVAALPFRRTTSGEIELMLVTSRETRRFVLPKGWPMKGKSDARAAAQEAAEEAGVTGKHGKHAVGQYQYWKRLPKAFVPVTVMVYPLEVEQELPDWPERESRKTAWVTLEQAIQLVDEPELMSLLRKIADEGTIE